VTLYSLVILLSQFLFVWRNIHFSFTFENHFTNYAAAKSLRSCPTLCDPIDGSPPVSSVHGVFQARVLERGAIASSITNYRILNWCFFVFSQHLKLFHSTVSLFGWFLSRTGYNSYLYSFIDKVFFFNLKIIRIVVGFFFFFSSSSFLLHCFLFLAFLLCSFLESTSFWFYCPSMFACCILYPLEPLVY